MDAEAELAVVIRRRVRRITEALGVVAGYVCANDVNARDLQFADGQWLRAKGFDTFCPVSTEIVGADVLGDASA